MNTEIVLNSEQQLAVETVDEAVLVMAPVGTGKTNILTLRAASAVRKGASPRHLLCLSFTNKAAREMKSRLLSAIGGAARDVETRTFHGLCAMILRAEARTLGIPSDFVIYDEEDSREVFGRLWRSRGLQVPGDQTDRLEFLLAQAAGAARLSRFDDAQGRSPQEVFEQVLGASGLPLRSPEDFQFNHMLYEYVHELRDNCALDFTDLIVGVNRLWDESPDALARWQERFTWIQVDEVQDTSRAEFRVLARLAERHRQLSFFGDLDQTIYEWRGSAPFAILDDYRRQFAPVREVHLTRNYRSTRNILNACGAVLGACPHAATRQLVSQSAVEGDPVILHQAADVRSEAAWIASRIEKLRAQHGLRYRDFAILLRTNFRARDLSTALEQLKLPHIQVEQFKFFQREEIKHALAHLRLVVTPRDGASLRRFLKAPPKCVGSAVLQDLEGEPKEAGLRLTDLLDPSTIESADPFLPLLQAFWADRVVVFDTETTGVNALEDDIVEIAAARCGTNGIVDRFHAYLRPEGPVGVSFGIHGWSDAFLAEHGRPANEALADFAAWCGDCLLAGHNIHAFDLPMLRSACSRRGVAVPGSGRVFDTLDIARRCMRVPRYTLARLAEHLELRSHPEHHAEADVACTVELLAHLVELLTAGSEVRAAAVRRYHSTFLPIAGRLWEWQRQSEVERPAELLRRVLEESGLIEMYRKRPDGARRLGHLDELTRLFARNDDDSLPPRNALTALLELASLGTDLDRHSGEEDKVCLLTVHQAKGLEFDTVFVAQAVQGEFPSRRSCREGREIEEHRLFYVALTRARHRLFVTWAARDEFGRDCLPSPYLEFLRLSGQVS